MSDGLRSGKASRNDVFLTRSLNYRRFNIVFLAVPAGIGIVDVFFYYRLRRKYFQCSNDFLADFGHAFTASGADQLCAFQALVEPHEAVTLPVQRFYPVPASAAE